VSKREKRFVSALDLADRDLAIPSALTRVLTEQIAAMEAAWAGLREGELLYDSRVDTYEHIEKVRALMIRAAHALLVRAHVHDRSKLESPEVEVFNEFSPKLAEVEYGSAEYEACRKGMGEALEHHYAHNSHHPEGHEAGIAGMSLLDLLEMLCDWKAASERVKSVRPPAPAAAGRAAAPDYDSNLMRSIGLNQDRFGYGDELRAILENTARELQLV